MLEYKDACVVMDKNGLSSQALSPTEPVKNLETSIKTASTGHRRSHTKSRGGCVVCKTRKTKCGEEKPSCLKCMRRGTDCLYERDDPSRTNRKRTSLTTKISAFEYPPMSPTYPVMFTGRDIRFFHHFLTSL